MQKTGPLWNGVIVATLPYIGAFGVSDAHSLAQLPPVIHADAMIVGLVYAGFVLTGYFKDVTGDSVTGYRTAPVVYGIQNARWHVISYTVAALCGVGVYSLDLFGLWEKAATETRMIFMILELTAVIVLILSNIILFRDPSEKNSYRSLLWYTRGMVLSFLSPIALVHSIVAVSVSVVFLAAMEYFLSKTKRNQPGMMSGLSARNLLWFVLLPLFAAESLSIAQTLKIATLNVWSGVDYKGTWCVGEFENDSVRQRRLDIAISELKALRPDIVALQECNPVAAVASKIAKAMGYDFIYQRANSGIKLGPVGVPWNLNEGLALLAKKDLHLDFVDVVDLSRTFGAFGNCFSLHASDQNIAIIGSVTVGRTEFLIVNMHLSAAVPDKPETRGKLTELMRQHRIPDQEQAAIVSEFSEQARVRRQEIARLREYISDRGSAVPIVLLGDLNATQESQEVESLLVQFLDCTPVGKRNEPTWDAAHNPNVLSSTGAHGNILEDLSAWYDGIPRRIDYIFLDRRFFSEDIRSVLLFANTPEEGLFPSDHFGLAAEIDFSRFSATDLGMASEEVRSPAEKFEFLPLFSYDTDVGFGYGVKAFFLDFLNASESFDVILFNSTKGERWYRLVFSVPDFELRQGKRYPLSLDFILDYDKYTKNNFFGVGSRRRSSDGETYTKEPLELQLVASRGFNERFVGQVGIRFKVVRNFAFDSAGLFAASAPINLGQSKGLSLFTSVRFDSRNSFINPSRGSVVQLDIEGGSSGFVSDYDLFSSTLSLQTYHVLFYPQTVFAARVVGQTVSGTGLPLHSYVTLGGTRTLRGFPQDRFLDRSSVVANVELRFPIVWRFDGLVFFDAGKLASSIGGLALLKGGWKTNGGVGLRFLMDTFIVRADLGISSEGTGFYLNFGHLF